MVELLPCTGPVQPSDLNAYAARRRLVHGIVLKNKVQKHRVSWEEISSQMEFIMLNIYRLRLFWVSCQSRIPMQLITFDLKPVLFNTVGNEASAATEGGPQPGRTHHFNQTRDRYTIITSMVSDTHDNKYPKMVILFRGRMSELEDADRHRGRPW